MTPLLPPKKDMLIIVDWVSPWCYFIKCIMNFEMFRFQCNNCDLYSLPYTPLTHIVSCHVLICIKQLSPCLHHFKCKRFTLSPHKSMKQFYPVSASLALLILFFCLFGFSRLIRKFFTHLEMSPLPMKGCNFWPMLSTYGHWAVRVL